MGGIAHRTARCQETQATNPIIRWEYLFVRERTPDELWARARQHLELTVVPVVLGTMLSGALAALVLRFRWARGPVFAVTGFSTRSPAWPCSASS
jgi:ABC-type proline/glycine betaine transport system permease subunit